MNLLPATEQEATVTVKKGAAGDASSREIVLDASRISSDFLVDYFWLDFAHPCVIALDFF